MPDKATRDELQNELARVRDDADAILEVIKLEALREVVRHSMRDVIEASEWLSTTRQLGEAGALRLARISLTAARERLTYVQQLRETYGPGVMFHR
jgi:hypothetical protein